MKDVALDACCLINLLAAECVFPRPGDLKKVPKALAVPSTLPSLGLALHIPTVVTGECYYMLQPDPDDPGRLVKVPIDLGPYFTGKILHPCDVVGQEESGLLVNYATRLDDVEAACLAVAKTRGWGLATDDRVATSLAVQEGIVVLTSAELMKRWAKHTKATKATITEALTGIQKYARFVPRPNSAEAEWWLSHLTSA